MDEPKQGDSEYSDSETAQVTKHQPIRSSADHTDKEQQAVALINQGKLKEAEEVYREVIASGTSNHMIYGNLAVIYGMQGKFEDMISLLNKTLELNPNCADAHNNLGVALKEQGKLTAAIVSYNRALEHRPYHPDTHYNLGIVFQEQGNLTAAISCYIKALELKPYNPDAHYNLGVALKEQGDLNAAITSYNKALELKPNYPQAHNNLGNALKEQDDLTAAIASYNTALQLNPNYPEAHNNLGIALQEQGNLTAAITSFNKAIQLKPDYTDAHNNLGVALQKQTERTNSVANSIGSRGALEVFAHYIENQAQLADDTELNNFMLFYTKNYSSSSSQWSQDIFALYALNSKKNGLFLEIGGADGITHSNTYSLEKQYGWRGTLVEPDPYQFKLLSTSRPENTLINAAISPNDQEEKLRLRLAGQLSALVGHEGKDMHYETRLNQKSFAKVNAISITRLLSEKKYDYFSLDVEGAELSILKSIKWDAILKPSILTIEHNFREEDKRDILIILKTHGYIECLASHDWLRRGDIWATLNE